MSIKSLAQSLKAVKPFVAVILLQFGFAGLSIITKFALNQGISQHVLVPYRHAVAAAVIAPFALVLERKTRPKMTYAIFTKIMFLGLLEPVIDQNLFYTGMKSTTATFAAAMSNILPAFVFILAWIFRLEKVDIKRIHSLVKVLGTIVTVGGAMFMTLFNGPMLSLPWAKPDSHHHSSTAANNKVSIKGSLMIAAGCVGWSSFMILQAITLKSYPAELSLTVFICLAGATQGSLVAVALEWGNPAAWSIGLDAMLLASLYSGIVCSGFTYYVQGVVMKEKGPVFVTAFNPLSMVIVAILSSFIFSEMLYLGRVVGAVIIVAGLYMVLWGKSKDKPPSELSNKVLSPADEYMTVMNERDRELADIDSAREKRGDESV
ncbi:Plant-drug/metabolite exporter [Parasponia andersonii]|uniref:WAT1-related protein n=1 Tax=Parasponia andersonii TaxID=3476 RepID=A0A2P5DPT7_PARAD|nr:Plant-drug/metabolite exporter [Parasponia andersonii]